MALCGLIAFAFVTASTQALAEVVARKTWGAKPAIEDRMRRHTISGLMLHHTSVRQQPGISLERKMRGLQGFSMRTGRVGTRPKPAWGDVPYHFYIGVSGRIAEGRSLAYAGDTNTRYQTQGWIQIVVEGDFKKNHPTDAQIASLGRLFSQLRTKFGIPASRIAGHNDHASTDCPGPNLKRYLPLLRQ